MIKITQCENCPFDVSGNHSHCNHPLAPTDSSLVDELEDDLNCQKHIHYDFDVPKDEMPKTDTTSWGRYHFETKAIPKWCPLRSLTHIDIGIKMEIDLDKQLFEENFTQ